MMLQEYGFDSSGKGVILPLKQTNKLMMLFTLRSDLFDRHSWYFKEVCDSELTVNNWLSLTSKLFCLSYLALLYCFHKNALPY